MLSDRDRTLLAPHLAKLRVARDELTAARRGLDGAERRLYESRVDTDWRDRSFGGLFSRDSGRTRRYREALRDRKVAASAVERREGRVEHLATGMDSLLDPILARADPAYRLLLAALHECDRALAECRVVGHGVETALDALRTATATSGADVRARQDGRFAERRHSDAVARVREAAPGLRKALGDAAHAVRHATSVDPVLPWRLDATSFGRLPVTGHAAGGRQHLLRGRVPLQTLHGQLAETAATVLRWRAHAEAARRTALRAAQDLLA